MCMWGGEGCVGEEDVVCMWGGGRVCGGGGGCRFRAVVARRLEGGEREN